MADNYRDGVVKSAADEGGGVFSDRVTLRVGGADVGPGNPLPTSAGGGGGGAATIADGADVAEGAVADAVVAAGAAGTVSAKLRRLTADLSTLLGYVDGLETLVGTTNTLLTTQAGYLDGLETLVGTTNTLLVAPAVTAGTLTDRSGTVTLGGTSQQVAAANAARRYLLIVNLSTTVLWVNFGVAAVAGQPSIPLAAASSDNAADGGSIVFEGSLVPSATVNLLGATTAKPFTAKEG